MIEDFKRPPERKPIRLDSFPDRSGFLTGRPAGRTQGSHRVVEPLEHTGPSFEQVVAQEQEHESLPEPVQEPAPEHEAPQKLLESQTEHGDKKPFILFRPFVAIRHLSRKRKVVLAATLLLLGAGGTAFALSQSGATPVAVKKPAVVKPVPPPAPKPIYSPLTGMVVTAEQQTQPVTAVMVENSPDARPQSGLREAGVIYEAIAEGGITRFMALYQESAPGNIGPIRSARPYYLDWLLPFDGSLAHVGGSPDALQAIKDLGVKDLDQFFNAGAYHRISSRYAPHNMYSGVNTLSDLGKSKGWTTSTFTGFERKAEKPYVVPAAAPATPAQGTSKAKTTTPPADTRTPSKGVTLNISSFYYNARFDYNPATNSYLRSQAGAAHMDADSNTQLESKVVVALVMPYGLMADGKHSEYGTTGSGQMFVYQDGTVTPGTWTKAGTKSQFQFADAGGAPLKLNPGQTWITVVGDAGKVVTTP